MPTIKTLRLAGKLWQKYDQAEAGTEPQNFWLQGNCASQTIGTFNSQSRSFYLMSTENLLVLAFAFFHQLLRGLQLDFKMPTTSCWQFGVRVGEEFSIFILF